MKFRVLVLVLIALGAIATGASSVQAQGHQVPFSGSYSGTVVPGAPTVLEGTGRSTHMGRGTSEGTVVITGPAESCPGGLSNINDETLIAANGDTLTLTIDDEACPGAAPGLFDGTGPFEVTGGTGRFEGATGQGTFEGHIDLIEGRFSFTVSGTISAPNSR